ncbi:MAG: VWA-like domain-containing protein [Candidatus Bathyarchaeia archaeon]
MLENEVIEIAKIKIAKNFPYLLPLVYSIDIQIDENIPFVAGVRAKDGKIEMKISLEKFKKECENIINVYGAEKAFFAIFMHELMHIINAHIITKRDLLKNVAMDLVVNDILKDSLNVKFELNEVFEEILNVEFKNYGWEEVYDMLRNNRDAMDFVKKMGMSSGNGGGKSSGDGLVISEEVDIDEESVREVEKKVLEGIEISEKIRGLDSLGEMLKAMLLKPKVNWYEILRNIIFDVSYKVKDYSFRKISKKSYAIDVILPGQIKEEEVNLNIVIDASGSINEEELSNFVSEVKSLVEQFEINGKIFVHDAKVLYKDDVRNVKNDFNVLLNNLKGGGGTSHKEVFEEIRKQFGRVINIIFTDGYSDLEEISDVRNYENIFVVGKGYNKEIERMGKVIVLA